MIDGLTVRSLVGCYLDGLGPDHKAADLPPEVRQELDQIAKAVVAGSQPDGAIPNLAFEHSMFRSARTLSRNALPPGVALSYKDPDNIDPQQQSYLRHAVEAALPDWVIEGGIHSGCYTNQLVYRASARDDVRRLKVPQAVHTAEDLLPEALVAAAQSVLPAVADSWAKALCELGEMHTDHCSMGTTQVGGHQYTANASRLEDGDLLLQVTIADLPFAVSDIPIIRALGPTLLPDLPQVTVDCRYNQLSIEAVLPMPEGNRWPCVDDVEARQGETR